MALFSKIAMVIGMSAVERKLFNYFWGRYNSNKISDRKRFTLTFGHAISNVLMYFRLARQPETCSLSPDNFLSLRFHSCCSSSIPDIFFCSGQSFPFLLNRLNACFEFFFRTLLSYFRYTSALTSKNLEV